MYGIFYPHLVLVLIYIYNKLYIYMYEYYFKILFREIVKPGKRKKPKPPKTEFKKPDYIIMYVKDAL